MKLGPLSLKTCRWCDRSIVKHHVGNDVVIWVHADTNVTFCFPHLAVTARPLRPRGRHQFKRRVHPAGEEHP